MGRSNGGRVLAIGLDAAEPTLVRHLIEQDQMPALKALLAEGRWLRVRSPADIGSGCVWPTFATGKDPLSHGIYGEWCWQPETMGLSRYVGRNIEPFWKKFSEDGITVGVLDPPFVRMMGVQEGFEIIEWGPHDVLDGRLQAGPAAVSDLVTKQFQRHPFATNSPIAHNPSDPNKLNALSEACMKGAALRGNLARALLDESAPDFALIVFPEIHHASHYLWHATGDYDSSEAPLSSLCREVDRQVASLVEAAAGARVMVFSLHGMRPSAGVPAFLDSLLCEKAFAYIAGWKAQSPRDLTRSLMAAVKRRAPSSVKDLYYRALPSRATKYLAQPTMLPPYDWARTRAFSLPTDQHGWIRINLRGRESAGIVALKEYDETCQRLEDLLHGLRTEDGKPLVDQISRTAIDHEATSSRLPDLVVHWSDAAFIESARIEGSATKVRLIGKKFTGQHAADGFCILSGRTDVCANEDVLHARDMHLLITKLLD